MCTHSCTLAEMKKIASTFDYNLWANNANPEARVMSSGKLIRAGKKGQGKAFFNDEGREISTSCLDHTQTLTVHSHNNALEFNHSYYYYDVHLSQSCCESKEISIRIGPRR